MILDSCNIKDIGSNKCCVGIVDNLLNKVARLPACRRTALARQLIKIEAHASILVLMLRLQYIYYRGFSFATIVLFSQN